MGALASVTAALAQYPEIDGSDNSPNGWGRAGSPFIRVSFPAYADGGSSPSGADRPNPRTVSNAISAQSGPMPNERGLSDFVWQWGQFIDHDIALTQGANPVEAIDIEVLDESDPLFNAFDPFIHQNRSQYDAATGVDSPRQQVNSVTSFLDASMVYGADPVRAAALRTFQGGRLKTEDGDLLPFNTEGLPNANDARLFLAEALRLAGDVRANEQPGLVALHTLFVREHNRLADEIAAVQPELSDEEIYQRARTLVRAEIQAVTYNEFLPALMGDLAPGLSGRTYRPSVEPTLINEFAAAAFRFGHSLVSPRLQRLYGNGVPYSGGAVSLRDAFFNPEVIASSGDLDLFIKGLTIQLAQQLDTRVNDELRNFLFGPPGSGGLDLVSLNIQRGRDHGFPSYNEIRQAIGLSPKTDFFQITSDAGLVNALNLLYQTPGSLDLFVGILAEDPLPGSSVGETLAAFLDLQFSNLMEGDRFFFLWDTNLSDEQREEIQRTRLSDILLRNTEISDLQENVFLVPAERLDSDFDGMPDYWETTNGFSKSDPSDAVLDADEDGITNLEEFIAGTDPRSDESIPALSISSMPEDRVMLSFSVSPGHSYTVYHCENLEDNDWKVFFDMPTVSVTRMMQMMDEMPVGPGHRFYKLIRE